MSASIGAPFIDDSFLAKFGEFAFSINPTLQAVQDNLLKLPPESERVKRREKLEELYPIVFNELMRGDPERPSREVALLFGEIFSYYGQTFYGDGTVRAFSLAREYLLCALEIQWYVLGMQDKIYLTDLTFAFPKEQPFFRQMHDLVTTTRHETLFSKISDLRLNEHQTFVFAYPLRWISGSYGNLTTQDPLETPQRKVERKTNLLELAFALLSKFNTKEIRNELRELRYNDLPGYYKDIGRLDLYTANWKLLEDSALQDKDRKMLVRVYNKLACSTRDIKEALSYLKKAHEQYQLMTEEERHPVLYHVFLSNYAFLQMLDNPKELAQPKAFLDQAYAFVKQQRSLTPPKEDYNFRFINLNFAYLYRLLGKFDEAQNALDALAKHVLPNNEDADFRVKFEAEQYALNQAKMA